MLYVGTTDGALWASRDGGTEWTNLYEVSAEDDTEGDDDSDEAGDRPRRGDRGGGRRRGGGRMLQMLQQADANNDGLIQKDEVPDR